MFVVSTALTKAGIGKRIKIPAKTLQDWIPQIYASIALFSGIDFAFINNTPVVVVLLPVVMALSKSLGVSSSKFLFLSHTLPFLEAAVH